MLAFTLGVAWNMGLWGMHELNGRRPHAERLQWLYKELS